jgi:hypothetical protein
MRVPYSNLVRLLSVLLSARYLEMEWWNFYETCLWYLVCISPSLKFDKFHAYLMRLLQSDWLNVFRIISFEGMMEFWWTCSCYLVYKSFAQVRCSTNSVHISWGCCNQIGWMFSSWYLLKKWWDFDETCSWYLVHKSLAEVRCSDKFRAYFTRLLQSDWLNVFHMGKEWWDFDETCLW